MILVILYFLLATPVQASEFDSLIERYSNNYGVSYKVVDCIIKKESSYNPEAKNPNSTASGLGQFLESTWIWMRGMMGEDTDLALRFNPEESIKTLSWALSKGYGPHWTVWRSCYATPKQQGESIEGDQEISKDGSSELDSLWDNFALWSQDQRFKRVGVQNQNNYPHWITAGNI